MSGTAKAIKHVDNERVTVWEYRLLPATTQDGTATATIMLWYHLWMANFDWKPSPAAASLK